jgi:hypothetical protein
VKASYYGRISGFEVTVEMNGCHALHTDYPLLPGDLLKPRPDGTFYKFGPGLGIEGFVLTEEQKATLQPALKTFGMGGMDYFLSGDA